jgi:hypothetical protein
MPTKVSGVRAFIPSPLFRKSRRKIKTLYKAIRSTLLKGIDFGGDSMSDYRNIHGKRGAIPGTASSLQKAR